MKRLLLGLLLASPTLLFAQGSQVNTQSLKAVGMSGAGSALFIDESSIFYSPGALSKMDHNAISAGVSGIMYRSAFREANSMDVHHTKFKITPPFSVFATFGPKDTWWKAGLGIYTPFGGSVDWGDQWPGKYELNYLQMRAIYIQPTISFKLTENFGIGGGFIYNIGLVDLGRSIPLASADAASGKAELSGVGTGMGYNVGVHYHLENTIAISLSYRSKINTKLKDGDAEFTVPPALAASFPNTTFSAELPLPASFNIGVSFPVSERVDIAADGTFLGYDIYKELVFDYKDNTAVLQDTEQPKKYENAFSGKVGVNYKTTDKLALRAGAGYVFTPVQANYVSPETPDNNRVMASAGFTYEVNDKWSLTGAYVFQHLLKRSVTSAVTNLSGTYVTNIHAPGISLTYKW
ncbi:OmpP1/FadL family transporter [Sphingobacterium psychroaquaticum]|uniref:Long-chain fatty acid transport protein n=1 Tax=Sphingobacterium psychroaquaticum TaxID=561061 RepID=A0A1X7KHC7_9SPHI|nr:outer membrane protein transport protein [Sphingobacterium psychroaquaticum]SMG40317.1 long-chain fatty acid transport protein [Sphingobacterium psychroaquaticum]